MNLFKTGSYNFLICPKMQAFLYEKPPSPKDESKDENTLKMIKTKAQTHS